MCYALPRRVSPAWEAGGVPGPQHPTARRQRGGVTAHTHAVQRQRSTPNRGRKCSWVVSSAIADIPQSADRLLLGRVVPMFRGETEHPSAATPRARLIVLVPPGIFSPTPGHPTMTVRGGRPPAAPGYKVATPALHGCRPVHVAHGLTPIRDQANSCTRHA